MQVALTIDIEQRSAPAGADNPRRQLDVLAREGVPATCFVQGRWAAAFPQLVRRIREDGHLVGNHTYHHAPLTLMTDEGIRHTVRRAEEVILSRAGIATMKPWFRCPYGDGEHDERVLAVLAELGYRNVAWHVDPGDWRPERTVDEVVEAVVAGCRERGDEPTIVLMHSWPDVSLGALPLIVEDLRAEGASFITVNETPWP
jgi:peptidoglycan/xylan/chitin deacetylase (PgdA/CDA1 family)